MKMLRARTFIHFILLTALASRIFNFDRKIGFEIHKDNKLFTWLCRFYRSVNITAVM